MQLSIAYDASTIAGKELTAQHHNSPRTMKETRDTMITMSAQLVYE